MPLSVNQLVYRKGGLAEQRPKRDTQAPDEKQTSARRKIFRAFRSWRALRSCIGFRSLPWLFRVTLLICSIKT